MLKSFQNFPTKSNVLYFQLSTFSRINVFVEEKDMRLLITHKRHRRHTIHVPDPRVTFFDNVVKVQ